MFTNILDPLNEEKNYLSALFFENILPELTKEVLLISEKNQQINSYTLGNLIEIYFNLNKFLLESYEIKMINHIME